jgi:predicted DNA-binding transcriptional regulator AlpA
MKAVDSLAFEPVLVDSKAAAAACGVSRSTFLSWDAAGLCPRPVRIVGRVLWVVADLRRWAVDGCPSREQFEAAAAAREGAA